MSGDHVRSICAIGERGLAPDDRGGHRVSPFGEGGDGPRVRGRVLARISHQVLAPVAASRLRRQPPCELPSTYPRWIGLRKLACARPSLRRESAHWARAGCLGAWSGIGCHPPFFSSDAALTPRPGEKCGLDVHVGHGLPYIGTTVPSPLCEQGLSANTGRHARLALLRELARERGEQDACPRAARQRKSQRSRHALAKPRHQQSPSGRVVGVAAACTARNGAVGGSGPGRAGALVWRSDPASRGQPKLHPLAQGTSSPRFSVAWAGTDCPGSLRRPPAATPSHRPRVAHIP